MPSYLWNHLEKIKLLECQGPEQQISWPAPKKTKTQHKTKTWQNPPKTKSKQNQNKNKSDQQTYCKLRIFKILSSEAGEHACGTCLNPSIWDSKSWWPLIPSQSGL